MYQLITPSDMRALEADFMAKTGYPSILLMEHAAQAIHSRIAAHALLADQAVLFLCGPGQNGGDGFAAARLHKGRAVVWQLSDSLTGDAALNAALLAATRNDIPIVKITQNVPAIPQGTALIVDALLGTGLCRDVTGVMADAIHAANASGLPIIAADIPSGINGLTGDVCGCAIKATETVTFHRAKTGFYLKQAVDHTGQVHIADIGIVPHWGDAAAISVLEASDYAALRTRRKRFSHKGDYGRVLVIGGSEGFAGAAALCAKAAIRAGAGLTTVACDEALIPIIQTLFPCAMCVALNDKVALERVLHAADAVAIGPGLGVNTDRTALIKMVMALDKPVVFDADALNILAKEPSLLKRNGHFVYTPHPGEAKRLLDRPLGDAVFDAHALADMLGGTVLLKGTTSIICDKDDTRFNTLGSPAMAKGGSGDVLTGVIAALLAQGYGTPIACVQLAALMHGMAGLSAAALGEHGVDAMMLLEHLPA